MTAQAIAGQIMGKYDHLIGKEIERGSFSWDFDRALLYAVGVGAGLQNPLEELEFTTENSPGVAQQVLPTFLVLMLGRRRMDSLAQFRRRRQRPRRHGAWRAKCHAPAQHPGPGHGQRLARGERCVRQRLRRAAGRRNSHVTLADTGEALGSARTALFVQGRGGFGGPRNRPRMNNPGPGPIALRTTSSLSPSASTNRSSTASRATAPCTAPTPRAPMPTVFPAPSSSALAPSASPAARCCAGCAVATSPASAPSAAASPSRSSPATRWTPISGSPKAARNSSSGSRHERLAIDRGVFHIGWP